MSLQQAEDRIRQLDRELADTEDNDRRRELLQEKAASFPRLTETSAPTTASTSRANPPVPACGII